MKHTNILYYVKHKWKMIVCAPLSTDIGNIVLGVVDIGTKK